MKLLHSYILAIFALTCMSEECLLLCGGLVHLEYIMCIMLISELLLILSSDPVFHLCFLLS